MTGWFYAVVWVVILTSLVVSIWSMVYARKVKREYLIAAAEYRQAVANLEQAAETLRMVAGANSPRLAAKALDAQKLRDADRGTPPR